MPCFACLYGITCFSLYEYVLVCVILWQRSVCLSIALFVCLFVSLFASLFVSRHQTCLPVRKWPNKNFFLIASNAEILNRLCVETNPGSVAKEYKALNLPLSLLATFYAKSLRTKLATPQAAQLSMHFLQKNL